MNFTKYLQSSLLVIFLFYSCKPHNSKVLKNGMNYSVLNYNDNRPMLFISCVRCGFFNDNLNKVFIENPENLIKFDIYADSLCTEVFNFRQLIKYKPQVHMDSLFDENYNVFLLKKEIDDKYTFRLIETKESDQLNQILSKF